MLHARSKYLIYLFLLLAVISLLLLFPGSYSVDSIIQYEQILGNSYHDWHSPVLPFVWKILIAITGKYYSIYLFQMFFYWLFFYLLLFKITANNSVILAGTIIAAFSVFMPQYVMKDAHMIISWGMAFIISVLLYRNKYSTGYRYFLVCLAALLIMYGTSLRLSNVIVSFFLFYMLLDAANATGKGVIKKLALTVLLCGIAIVSSNVFIYKVLKAEKRYPEYKLMLLDVVGISKQTGKNYIPAFIQNTGFDYAKLMEVYTPASVDDLYWPKDGAAPMFRDPNKELNDTLSKHWAVAVKENPVAYLKNRWQGFLYFLHIKERFDKSEYWDVTIYIHPNEYGIERRSKISPHGAFTFHYFLHNNTIFFAPWFWLLINTILFAYCVYAYQSRRNPEYKLQALMQLSGIVLLLSMLLVYQHDQDFRYTYWNYIVAFIGLLHCMYLRKNPENGVVTNKK